MLSGWGGVRLRSAVSIYNWAYAAHVKLEIGRAVSGDVARIGRETIADGDNDLLLALHTCPPSVNQLRAAAEMSAAAADRSSLIWL